jgi:hypothetical protein
MRAWVTSLVAVSALFGWGHVDQGLTGQVQAAIDGLTLRGFEPPQNAAERASLRARRNPGEMFVLLSAFA